MSIRELDEFMFLCKKAGFKTLGEVSAYMKARGLNCWQLFRELDARLFPEFVEAK